MNIIRLGYPEMRSDQNCGVRGSCGTISPSLTHSALRLKRTNVWTNRHDQASNLFFICFYGLNSFVWFIVEPGMVRFSVQIMITRTARIFTVKFWMLLRCHHTSSTAVPNPPVLGYQPLPVPD